VSNNYFDELMFPMCKRVKRTTALTLSIEATISIGEETPGAMFSDRVLCDVYTNDLPNN